MDNAITVTGPHPASPAVQHCDAGEHRLGPGLPWWLITDPNRGRHHNQGGSCEAHLRAKSAAAAEGHLYGVGDLSAPTAPAGRKAHLWLDCDGDTRSSWSTRHHRRTACNQQT